MPTSSTRRPTAFRLGLSHACFFCLFSTRAGQNKHAGGTRKRENAEKGDRRSRCLKNWGKVWLRRIRAILMGLRLLRTILEGSDSEGALDIYSSLCSHPAVGTPGICPLPMQARKWTGGVAEEELSFPAPQSQHPGQSILHNPPTGVRCLLFVTKGKT